jgi:hypothetical protein
MEDQDSISWGELAELTHATQVERFGFCMCEDNEGNENPYPDCDKYYSADLSISMVEIKARSKEEAEAIMQEFIDKIAPIMDNKVRWDEANWEIQENVLNKEEGVWEMSDVEADADTLASAGFGTDEDYA